MDNDVIIAGTDFKPTLERSQELLEILSKFQTDFVVDRDIGVLFDGLLSRFLSLTDSEYGFIGEILVGPEGNRYLKSHAITNIAWNAETRQFYDDNAASGLEFFNLKTLFGEVIRTGKMIISNAPKADPLSGGLPDGHPPLNAFLGLPLYTGDEFISMIGIANRQDGYGASLVEYLKPLIGATANFIAIMRHERAQQKSEEALRYQLALLQGQLETSPDGILVVGLDRVAANWNQRFLDIWGLDEADLKVGSLDPALKKVSAKVSDPDEFEARIKYLNQHPDEVEGEPGAQISMRDGRVFERHSRGLVDQTGKYWGRIWFYRDVTERKKIDAMKSEFIALVSHELRTPLTSIHAALKLLKITSLPGNLDASAIDLIDISVRNSDRLLGIVDDILDLEKIITGEMDYVVESVQIFEMLEEAVATNVSYAQQFDVTLELAGPPVPNGVQGDRKRLLQVMANLLSNAAKFSPEGGTVRVSAQLLENHTRISVADDGPGIPIEFHDKMFERFTQIGELNTRKRGGSGLGLGITKVIVERHGGTISFDTSEAEGTTFHVDLPIDTA